jgi:hypothetical protein
MVKILMAFTISILGILQMSDLVEFGKFGDKGIILAMIGLCFTLSVQNYKLTKLVLESKKGG